jgi:hypothetical protein
MPTTGARWSHEQGVAYECAKECLSHLMALCSERIAAEGAKPEPDEKRVQALEADLLAMGCERRELGLFDAEHIAEIRRQYGGWIAAHSGERPWRDDVRELMAECYPAFAAGGGRDGALQKFYRNSTLV